MVRVRGLGLNIVLDTAWHKNPGKAMPRKTHILNLEILIEGEKKKLLDL